MGTLGEDDREEMIKCLQCRGDVPKAQLIDHIAGKHMGYILHKCDECDFGNFDLEKAIKHVKETRHRLVLNECSYNAYTEGLIKKVFEDSVAESAVKREEAVHVPSSQVTMREREASSTRDNITPTAVEERGEGTSKFATSTAGVLPPPVMSIKQAQLPVKVSPPLASYASTVAQKNPSRDQCHLCFVVVPDRKRKDHVFGKHLDEIVLCPVSCCEFEVSSNSNNGEALGKIRKHVDDQHGGFKTLTSDEKSAYKQNKRHRRRVAGDIYRDCFPDCPMRYPKRMAPDNDREQLDNDGGISSQPKMIKHE